METLNRRNTETVEIKLKEMSSMIYEQSVKINSLHTALSSMSQRLDLMEKMVLDLKVKLTGNGASVK